MKKEKNISSFKTPEGYFENFEENLFLKMKENNFPKTSGFVAPSGYFDDVEDRLLNTLVSKEKSEIRPLFPRKYWGYAAAVAASLIIGLLVFPNLNENKGLDNLQLATIDKYINDGNLDIDLYDVSNFISDDDILELSFEEPQLSEVSLKSYLLENVDEETLINNEK